MKNNFEINKYFKPRENKEFSPAIREWHNSVYFFNKDNIKNSLHNDNLTNRIINSYLNLNLKYIKPIFISRRKREMTIRSSTKQLFVSRSYIKQTTDKSIITVYIYNRLQKEFLNKIYTAKNVSIRLLKKTKQLMFYNNNQTESIKNNLLNSFNKLNKSVFKNYNPKTIIANAKYNKYNRHSLLRKIKIYNYFNKKYNNYNVNFENKLLLSNLSNKIFTFKQLLFFHYIKWILSIFNFKVSILKKKNTKSNVNYKNSNNTKKKNNINTNIYLKPKNLNKKLYVYNYLLIYKTKNESYRNSTYSSKVSFLENNNIIKLFNLKNNKLNLQQINKILYKFIVNFLKNNYNINDNTLLLILKTLYKKYLRTNKRKFLSKFLKIEKFKLFHINRYNVSNFKTNSMILGLKLLLSNIYNKKIEFNIVNLKYPYLNSDILIKALVIKLRNRNNMLKFILDKCSRLITLGKKKHKGYVKNALDFKKANVFNNIHVSKIKTNVIIKHKDKLSFTLNTLYSNFNKSGFNILNNILLNNIRHKWVTGVRLEGKGRLSKRLVAARSMQNIIYKGNLKNQEHMNINSIKFEFYTPNAYLRLLRNNVKPNIEYTLLSSKRRIGAYGIKGWISSN